MKKYIYFIIALTAVLLLFGCSYAKIPGHGNGSNLVNEGNSLYPTSSDKLLSPAPSAEPLEIIPLQSYDNDSTLINPDAKKYIDNYSGYNKAEPLKVPLYSYESLLELGWDDEEELEKNYCVLLGNDYNYGLIKHPNFSLRLGELLTRIPEGAIRIMPSSNTGYVMHDTENGVRLFHFFQSNEGKPGSADPIIGIPALMCTKLSYSDYSSVRVGAELRSLTSIDPAMDAYADHFYGPFLKLQKGIINQYIDSHKDNGSPIALISILEDGALKIGLDYINGKFVVDTIEFSENFTLECYGGEICYRIAPVDYVE